ncbi:hypothetical protein GW916_07925 [bacterium]|nr:hypothetical protein [bacterium]
MLKEDFSLQFEGFSPSEEVIQRLKASLGELYAKAPSRSFLKASFKRTGKVIEGMIGINCSAGKFASKVSGDDFDALSSSAFSELDWQLKSWKAKRFI